MSGNGISLQASSSSVSVKDDTEIHKASAPDPKTVEMIRYYRQANRDHGFRLIESIRQNKDFGNPYILTKVVEHFKIDQFGSNYPKDVFDPQELIAEEFEENFKRRRTAVPATAANDPLQQPTDQFQSNNIPSQAPGGVPAAQAAALAAALASINARVAATNVKEPLVLQQQQPQQQLNEAELKRKSKWGQPSA